MWARREGLWREERDDEHKIHNTNKSDRCILFDLSALCLLLIFSMYFVFISEILGLVLFSSSILQNYRTFSFSIYIYISIIQRTQISRRVLTIFHSSTLKTLFSLIILEQNEFLDILHCIDYIKV